MSKVRVGVNGYGTIGKRVATAIAKQDDMELVGVTKTRPNYEAKDALSKGYGLYVPEESVEAFAKAGVPISGTIADMLGKDPYDALFDLLAAERCEAGMIDFIAAEEDIEAILRAPFSVPISDATYPVEGLCHPRVRQRGALSRALCPRARHPHAAAGCAQAHDAVRRPARSFPQGTHRRRRGRRPVPVLAGKYSGERRLHRSAAACLGHGRRVRRGRTGDHGRAVYRRDTGARAAGTLTNASFFRRKL